MTLFGQALTLLILFIAPHLAEAETATALPASFRLALESPSHRSVTTELSRLNPILSKSGMKPVNAEAGKMMPWLEVDQVYVPGNLESAVFAIVGAKSASRLMENHLYTLDHESKIISFSGRAGLPNCTLILWRLDEHTTEEIIGRIKHSGFSDVVMLLGIEQARATETVHAGPTLPEGATVESGGFLAGVGSCLATGFSAAGQTSRKILSDLGEAVTGNWRSPAEIWSKIKERWVRMKDFMVNFGSEMTKLMNKSSEAIRTISKMPTSSATNIICAAIGSLGPALTVSALVSGAIAKLAGSVINALTRLERFAQLFSTLDRLKALGQDVFAKGAKTLEEFAIKVLTGRISEKKLAEVEAIGAHHPALAMRYVSCIP